MLEINRIYCMDCLDGLKQLDDNSIDAVVTDPPYNLTTTKRWAADNKFSQNQSDVGKRFTKGFMGKEWDGTGIPFKTELWIEVLRVLKPGGHLLSFGGSRTYHRMACAVEDAGFEIRDQIMWVFGSGFPKSLDISKAIDKMKGAKREVIGKSSHASGIADGNLGPQSRETDHAWARGKSKAIHYDITNSSTPEAKEWSGWGTALKPAHEPIVFARKPLSEGTVAENVLRWNTGGLNIDKCRVGNENHIVHGKEPGKFQPTGGETIKDYHEVSGRFPANFIHDGSDEVLILFPDTGKSTGGRTIKRSGGGNVGSGKTSEKYWTNDDPGFGDSGSAARFFYCAKTSKNERNDGLEKFEFEKQVGHNRFDTCRNCGGYILQNPDRPSACKCETPVREYNMVRGNYHPTVKPVALMCYLCRLVTPPGGIVLDPFIGSGTTGIACMIEGFNFIGIEREQEYVKIAEARLEPWMEKKKQKKLNVKLYYKEE